MPQSSIKIILYFPYYMTCFEDIYYPFMRQPINKAAPLRENLEQILFIFRLDNSTKERLKSFLVFFD